MSNKRRNPISEPAILPDDGTVNPGIVPHESPELATVPNETVPGSNGNGDGLPAVPTVNVPPGNRRPKRPSTVVYLMVGETFDGRCLDVLGKEATKGRALKMLDATRMAYTRNYKRVAIFQCREVTAA